MNDYDNNATRSERNWRDADVEERASSNEATRPAGEVDGLALPAGADPQPGTPVRDSGRGGTPMARNLAMHNWMPPEPIDTTVRRLARFGYDGIQISGEPAVYDVAQVKELLAEGGLICWGGVTLMTGGRDLIHEDKYVRLGSIEYVKDCLRLIGELGGSVLTVIPSTVGKIVPMASPGDEWR